MEALAEAIKKSYPAEYDPETLIVLGPEMAYWRALGQIVRQAVTPLVALLAHGNAVVRGLAAQTLGELDAVAKPAAAKLKEALKDRFGFVAVEAACALCRIGEGKEEAVELVKRAIDAPNNVAQTAIDAIARMGEAGKPLVEPALKKLGDKENPYARFAAIGLVGTLPPAEAPRSRPMWESSRPTTSATSALEPRSCWNSSASRCARAAEALGKALATEMDEAIRDQFVDALIAMGPGAKPALPALLPLAADANAAGGTTREDHRGHSRGRSGFEGSGRCARCGGGRRRISRSAPPRPWQWGNSIPFHREPSPSWLHSPRRTREPIRVPRPFAHWPRPAPCQERPQRDRADGQCQTAGWAGAPGQDCHRRDGWRRDEGRRPRSARGSPTRSPTSGPRRWARSSISVRNRSDLPALTKLLKDRDETTREAAVRCLGRLGPAARERVPVLGKMLANDMSAPVRIAAAIALGEIGPTARSAIPRLSRPRFATIAPSNRQPGRRSRNSACERRNENG